MKHIKVKQSIFLSSRSLVLITFLLNLIWIFQGVDIKDNGTHITNQYILSKGYLCFPTPFAIFSDIIGGLWLHGISLHSLIWVRCGYLLLVTLCSFLSYSVLSYYFPFKRVWIACIATAIFVPATNTLFSINYDTFPAFLLCIIIFLVHKALISRPLSFWFCCYTSLSGFAFGILIFSRIPSLLGVFAGILVVGYSIILKARPITILYTIFTFILGMMVSAAISFIILDIYGFNNELLVFFNQYLNISVVNNAGAHGSVSLMKMYFRDFTKFVLVISVCFFTLIYFLSHLIYKIGKASTFSIFSGLLVCGIIFGYYHYGNNAFLVHYVTRWAVGFILCIIVADIYMNGRKWSGLVVLSIIIGFTTILPALGSNGGLGKSIHGMWISLPLALLLGWEMQTRVKSKAIKQMSEFIPIVIGMVFVLGLVLRLTWQYKEVDNRFLQTVSFKFPSMKGIYSHASRTKALDEVLFEISKRTKPGSPVVIEPYAPLLYYLSGTVPAFKASYIRTLSFEKRILRYKSTISSNRPDIVVLSLVNPKTENWPIKSSSDSDYRSNDDILIEIRREVIKPMGMKLLWTNNVFEIYGFPKND